MPTSGGPGQQATPNPINAMPATRATGYGGVGFAALLAARPFCTAGPTFSSACERSLRLPR